MKLVSQAGTSVVKLERSYSEGKTLVVLAKMGIWDSRIYVSQDDFPAVLKVVASWNTIKLALQWTSSLIRDRLRPKRKSG